MSDFSYEHWDPDDPLYDPEDDDADHSPHVFDLYEMLKEEDDY